MDEVVINDLNPGIAAFWRAAFQRSEELLDRLEGCEITITEWHRAVYLAEPKDDVELGFALFFLNRTNRSGILDARPIGGYEQAGRWKIDARFDRDGLRDRLSALSRYGSRVFVSEMDGINLIENCVDAPDSFVYADPPYLGKGDHLYLDTLHWEDHVRLAELLGQSGQWLLTYDADPRVTDDLYAGLRCAEFSMSHSAAVQHVGQEYAVFSPDLRVPNLSGLGQTPAKFLSAN